MLTGKAGHQPAKRQIGITEKAQEHLLLAALQFSARDSAICQQSIERLRGVIAAELRGELAEPSTETGELGFAPKHADYRLSVTVGFSTSAYEAMSVAADRRPRDLSPIPADFLDSSGAGQGAEIPGEGDVILKIASDDVYVAEHVLRRVEHELADSFSVVWAQTGAQRYNTRQGRNRRLEERALNGFLDGTSNLDPSNPDDRALIFTDHARTDYPPLPTADQYNNIVRFPPDLRHPPTEAESGILDGGSYMAVAVQLLDTADFDRQSIGEQDRSVGRQKITGDPVVPQEVASHVLKSNPGRPGDQPRRYLRRGYPLIRPHGAALGRGLVFIAFGRTLSTQVEFGHRAWINNEDFPHIGAGKDLLLSRFVQPRLLCGGYYFVPPLEHRTKPWSWIP